MNTSTTQWTLAPVTKNVMPFRSYALRFKCSLQGLSNTSMAIGLALLMIIASGIAQAAGTPAGTRITNSATANYSVAGIPATAVSSTVTLRVDELISVRVTAPVAPTAVNTPDVNKVLIFTVTNTGNGTESFTMSANLSPASAGDQFDPVPGSAGQLFLDTNNNGQFDNGVDTLISGPVPINADQSIRVFMVSNIPSGLVNGNQGAAALTAVSATPGAAGAAPGTILPNAGTASVGAPGIDAVVGVGPAGPADSGADDSATGVYIIATVTVALNKVVLAVTSPFGVTTTGCDAAAPPTPCSAFVPGTVIQYQVTVTVSGNGTAENVQITDNIPANTTYVANSIRFNAAARTDIATDADNASCTGCGNATGTVIVVVGNVTVNAATPVIHNIDYKVTIN